MEYTSRMSDGADDVQGLQHLLQNMIEVGAVPEVEGVYQFAVEELRNLEPLRDNGYVQEVNGTWKLTRVGARTMEYRHALSSPESLSTPRTLPLQDLSTFELICMLRTSGWSWQLLPKRPFVAREALRYHVA